MIDIPTLVALVVARAKTDKTEPDPKNLRVGWRTDQLLGDIHVLMCYAQNDPAGYAQIGRQVLAEVQSLPEMAALARLAIFRGERLLPPSEDRKRALLEMARELKYFIETLPSGERVNRCLSLLEYHTGVFLNDYGCFVEAAAVELQSAEIAGKAGNVSEKAISLFVATVYELKDALCSGSTDRIETSFAELELEYPRLVTALKGTALEVSWGEANAPMHLFEACVWLDKDIPEMDTWAVTILSAAEKLGEAWKGIADFVRAVQLHRGGQAGAEGILLALAANSKEKEELKASALLVLARRAKNGGDADGSRGFIQQMPKTGTQHIRAVAVRLFA